jgi:U4/U6.U5 tri-snRNP-associated protein 3
LDPDAPEEEGEADEVMNNDDEVMMAMMGLTGFGSTKVMCCRFEDIHSRN